MNWNRRSTISGLLWRDCRPREMKKPQRGIWHQFVRDGMMSVQHTAELTPGWKRGSHMQSLNGALFPASSVTCVRKAVRGQFFNTCGLPFWSKVCSPVWCTCVIAPAWVHAGHSRVLGLRHACVCACVKVTAQVLSFSQTHGPVRHRECR